MLTWFLTAWSDEVSINSRTCHKQLTLPLHFVVRILVRFPPFPIETTDHNSQYRMFSKNSLIKMWNPMRIIILIHKNRLSKFCKKTVTLYDLLWQTGTNTQTDNNSSSSPKAVHTVAPSTTNINLFVKKKGQGCIMYSTINLKLRNSKKTIQR